LEGSSVIAVDSKRHIRTWPSGEFFASMGSCLSIDNTTTFNQLYNGIVDHLLSDFGLKRQRHTYSSYQLAHDFGSRTPVFHTFLSDFTKNLLSSPGVKLTFFYTTLNTKRLEEEVADEELLSREDEEVSTQEEQRIPETPKPIQIYGREGSPIKQITAKEFLDTLDNYYVSICAWKLTDLTKIYNRNFILDGFEGEITDAWTHLTRSNNVAVAFKGDQCNACVSAADLITRFADLRLKLWRFPIVKDALYRAFNALDDTRELSKKFFVKRIWNPDMRMIVPSINRPIDISLHVLHPCIYLCKEENTAEERIRLENSPVFAEILDLAFERNGCVQFYEPKKHTPLMQEGDIFVVYGPEGKKEYSKLKKMKYNLDLREF